MDVQVVRLEEGEAGLRAALKTEGGVIWAYWRGEPPTRGQFSDVELAISGIVEWGRELQPLPGEAEAAAAAPALGCLLGTLERVDADGTAEVRVGRAVVLVSSRGCAPAPGSAVRLQGCEFAAYPSHL